MTSEVNLEKDNLLLDDGDSADDLTPQQLSGDQNTEKSLLMSDITGSKANFLLTVTTIMKTVVGAGILSLPIAVSKFGYVLSFIVLLIVISVMQFCSILLLKAKNLSKHSNYSSIAYYIFGTQVAHMVLSLMIMINNTGICIAEVLIIKKTVGRIFEGFILEETRKDNFFTSELFIVLVVALLQSPLTLVNKIEKLKLLALFGVSGTLVFVSLLIVVFFLLISEPLRSWYCSPDMVAFADKPLQMAVVVPNMMLALAYQNNIYPIFKGMKNASDNKMTRAALTGIIACSIFYVLVGNMGYCLFGNKLQGNFLLAFNRGDINDGLYLLMNISFLISVFFSFPIMFFGARNNFIAVTNNLATIINKKRSGYRQPDKATRKKQSKILFIVYTVLIFGIIISIAASLDEVENVFNILGAIASNSTCLIFPCMFYVMLIRKRNKPKKLHYWVALAGFIFFIPFGIFSVVSMFISENSGH